MASEGGVYGNQIRHRDEVMTANKNANLEEVVKELQDTYKDRSLAINFHKKEYLTIVVECSEK